MPDRAAWRALGTVTLLVLFAHVALEWLFFATKPSFLSPLRWGEKLLLPGAAAAPLLAAALVFLTVTYAAAGTSRWDRAARALARSLPALVLAATVLLLLDNFVYTLFGWGTPSLHGTARLATLPLFGALAIASYRGVRSWEARLAAAPSRRRALGAAAAGVVLLAAGAAAAERAGAPRFDEPSGARPAAQPRQRPDILLIGADGVNAEHLSVYGYHRPTTPYLDVLARSSLVCENAFSNATSTGGSTTALLTGRLPTTTGVIYPPDIARGSAAVRHLPGLLRRLGYRTGQFSIRWYADSADLNLHGAFEWANGREVGAAGSGLTLARAGLASAYFRTVMAERLAERLLPPRAVAADPFLEVVERRLTAQRDSERLRELLAFAAASDRPYFAHVHLMMTHGPTFAPRRPLFSDGQDQPRRWMTDFYDDAIRDFDAAVERVVETLRRRGALDRTVVVVSSDHGQIYTTHDRVPLLFRFPGGAHAGRRLANVQSVDVAPTLLDFLGLPPPSWMEGSSVLSSEPDPCRPILSAGHDAARVTRQGNWWFAIPRPPFYTLGSFSVLVGDRFHTLDLQTRTLNVRRVSRSAPASCPAVDPAAVRAELVERLRAAGYDVSTLDGGRR